ncbi:hypothetical protein BDV28DRAFT_143699 [Aspergillus coremiiformis]|uniref:Tetratricopeptide SHNi-TPR domain-containing protein n=1 Tax=Aspergillus coremiiformis TaxID=138285 RepID=A0A5N6YSF3_9EURO|nr:hypothetical protein BDV28DRAFT_143699 [Aspergillus coremiiformis]
MTEHKYTRNGAALPQNYTGDMRTHLTELTERAAAKDAVKDFNAATELYSEATELQARLNGELSLDNADLLYSYGKALYNVAVSRSDVLGTKVAGESQTQIYNAPIEKASVSMAKSVDNSVVQNSIVSGLAQKKIPDENAQSQKVQNKTYFQFTGDENFDASDSNKDDESDGEENVEEYEDDFANAFEALDLARILYLKKLNLVEEGCGKGTATDLPGPVKHIKERLADTYDLQAEISLEAERFADAVTDLKTALDLRQSLFPMEDPSVAECHYKLSLALEFASFSKEDDNPNKSNIYGKVNEEMRKEAASQMEKAIESCRLRMSHEQKILDDYSMLEEDKATATRRKIANVKDIIADMEHRLVDLNRLPVSLGDHKESDGAMIKGILGQIMEQSSAQQKAQLDKVTKEANDLSAFVKRRPGSKQQLSSTQKRSAQERDQGDVKRARGGSTSGPDS